MHEKYRDLSFLIQTGNPYKSLTISLHRCYARPPFLPSSLSSSFLSVENVKMLSPGGNLDFDVDLTRIDRKEEDQLHSGDIQEGRENSGRSVSFH